MIESTLIMSHRFIFYLYISGSFNTFSKGLSTLLRLIVVSFYIVWPFLVAGFLIYNRKWLMEETFQQKCLTLYNGLNIDRLPALLYISVFCLRRLCIVFAFLLLREKTFWLLFVFNAL